MNQNELLSEMNQLLHQSHGEWHKLKDLTATKNWGLKPGEGWSAFETLEHINITLDLYLDRMLETTSKLRNRKSQNQVYKPGIMGKMMIGMIRPSDQGKIKAIKTMKSMVGDAQFSEVELRQEMHKFEVHLEKFKSLLSSLENKDLNSRKINSAIGPLMRFRLGSAVEFLMWHHLRHFQQIERALQGA